jgi:hypothetical protein
MPKTHILGKLFIILVILVAQHPSLCTHYGDACHLSLIVVLCVIVSVCCVSSRRCVVMWPIVAKK